MAGFTLDRESISRISQMLRSYEQGMLSPPDIPGPDGSYSPSVQIVKVTGAKDAAGWQPGTIQIWNNASSSFTTGITCHIRASDASTLATNSIHLGRLSSVESNVPVFIVNPSGGLATVDEVDGSPTYSAITYLSFDQADGFALSNPSTGKVRIDISPASTSQTGVVNTTSQTFGGKKTFNNGINTYDVQLNGWDGGYAGIAMTHGWSTDPYNRNAVYIFADTTSGTSAWSYGLNIYWDGANSAIGSGDPGPNTYFNMLSMNVQGTQIVKVGTVGGSGFTGYLSSTASTFIVNGTSGLTGILKSNPQATGGIITNLGNTSTQSSSWMGF
jgi:hypothetical protein